MKSEHLRLAGLVAVTMIAFAGNSVLNRLALVDGATGPLSFAALRLLAGAAVLCALVRVKGGAGRLRRALSVPRAAALALYMLGFSLAYTALDAGLGALILFGGVQLTMFAGAMVLRETITPRRYGGAAVALAGLCWLLWPAGTVAVPIGGALLMLAAALGWGLFSLMGRGGSDPLAVTAGSFLIASVPVLFAALALWDGLSHKGALLAIVSGAVTSGLGYALWYSLLPRLEASVAAVAQLSVAPIAILAGVLMLGEVPDMRTLLAALVVLGGVMIAVTAAAPKGR